MLHVSIDAADGERLWHKTIPTMLVQQPPQWPAFGAVETKPSLRRADLRARRRRHVLVDELRPGVGSAAARRRRGACPTVRGSCSGEVELRAVLGRAHATRA